MYIETIYYVYLLILMLGAGMGLFRYNRLEALARIILLAMFVAGINEILTRIAPVNLRPYLYQVYYAIDFSILVLYFIKSVNVKRELLIVTISFMLIATLMGLNIYLQNRNMKTLNINLIVLECFSVIAMALYALYTILINDSIPNVTKYPHFWIWVLFLVLYSGTFFFWTFINLFAQKGVRYVYLAEYIQLAINILVYIGFGFVFYFYPRRAIE